MAATRSVTAVLFLGLAAVVFAVGSLARQNGLQSRSDVGSIEEMVREISGTIEIRGSIVDQNGVPLRGVEIEVDEARAFGVFGSSTNNRVSTVNSRFQVKRTDVLSIDCLFLKAGYYAERKSFSFSGGATDLVGKVHTIRDVVVALRKKPESAPLEKLEGYLRSRASGPLSVLDSRKLEPSDTPLTVEERRARKRLKLERPHIYLVPAVEGGDRLSQILVEIDGVAGMRPVLREGWIEFSKPDPSDGFLAADIPEHSPRVALGFRWMTEAPLKGYESRLRLSAESGEGEENVFFYCRIQGNYGKGVVTNMPRIQTENGDESAGARIIVYLNPTGSRDVSYLHP